MKHNLASEFVAVCLKQGADLNQLLWRAKAECTEEEFLWLRGAVGKIMGFAYCDIMNPLFKEFPDLEPDALKRPTPMPK